MPSTRDSRTHDESLGETVEAAGSRISDSVRANSARLNEELHEATERFSEGARKFSDAAVEQIRAHPLAAFGIAFACGIVASRLLRGR